MAAGLTPPGVTLKPLTLTQQLAAAERANNAAQAKVASNPANIIYSSEAKTDAALVKKLYNENKPVEPVAGLGSPANAVHSSLGPTIGAPKPKTETPAQIKAAQARANAITNADAIKATPAWKKLHAEELAGTAPDDKPNPVATPKAPPPASTTSGSTGATGPPTTTVTTPAGQTLTVPPVLTSLVGSAVPTATATEKEVQNFYAPALATLNTMQQGAINAQALRTADINAFTTFVTQQAQQSRDALTASQTGYTNMANASGNSLGGLTSDAQGMVNQNAGLAAESGLARGVRAAGSTLGAGEVQAQGVANQASANDVAAAGASAAATGIAGQMQSTGDIAQETLEENTFLPQIETIEQAIPGAAANLYSIEANRGIEAAKIVVAQQIAGMADTTKLQVQASRQATSETVQSMKDYTTLAKDGADNANKTNVAIIKANMGINVATIKAGAANAKTFIASMSTPGGVGTSWATFHTEPAVTQYNTVKGLLERAKAQGVTSFAVAMSSIGAKDPNGLKQGANSIYASTANQKSWAAAFAADPSSTG